MTETEVEGILREIRQRVLSEKREREAALSDFTATIGSEGNGASESGLVRRRAQNVELINSYLTTTARAWDRLPPLVSNRSGVAARFELWLKRRLKVASRWFTWEQVNFNAAVHHAIRDLLPVLETYDQELAELRSQNVATTEALRAQLEQYQEQHQKALDALRGEIAVLGGEVDLLRGEIAVRRNEIEDLRRSGNAQKSLFEARLNDLLRELRERDEQVKGEQRVAWKQLALESTEAAVLEDRARRKIETALEDLARRLQELEK